MMLRAWLSVMELYLRLRGRAEPVPIVSIAAPCRGSGFAVHGDATDEHEATGSVCTRFNGRAILPDTRLVRERRTGSELPS